MRIYICLLDSSDSVPSHLSDTFPVLWHIYKHMYNAIESCCRWYHKYHANLSHVEIKQHSYKEMIKGPATKMYYIHVVKHVNIHLNTLFSCANTTHTHTHTHIHTHIWSQFQFMSALFNSERHLECLFLSLLMNFALRYGRIRTCVGATPYGKPSSTNRIYTSGRVFKAEGL